MKPRDRFRLLFEPRDLWVGLFWNWQPAIVTDRGPWRYVVRNRLHLYFCPFPCLVLRVIL